MSACPHTEPDPGKLSPGWTAIGKHLMAAWFRGQTRTPPEPLEAALAVHALGESIDQQCRDLERQGITPLRARLAVVAFCEAYNETRRTAHGSMWALHDLGILRGLQAARHPPRSAAGFVEAVARDMLNEQGVKRS